MKINNELIGMWFITDDTLYGGEFFKSQSFGKVLFFVNENWIMVQIGSAIIWMNYPESNFLRNKLFKLQDIEDAVLFKEEKECKKQIIITQIHRIENSDHHKAAKKKEYINELEKLLKTLE
jgi:hypothetical protein